MQMSPKNGDQNPCLLEYMIELINAAVLIEKPLMNQYKKLNNM